MFTTLKLSQGRHRVHLVRRIAVVVHVLDEGLPRNDAHPWVGRYAIPPHQDGARKAWQCRQRRSILWRTSMKDCVMCLIQN